VLFGSGAFLVVKRDLIRVVAGVILLSNSANLFIVAAGLSRGVEPIYPLPAGERVSDPLVQALVLTAIVITFGTATIMLGLVYQVYRGAREGRESPDEAGPNASSDGTGAE
jgi:multicomponent Na+:H+ antiporter subunit C